MIAIGISILALLVSFWNVYFGTLRVSHNLYVIASYAPGFSPGKSIRVSGGRFQVKAIVVNNGNRSEAILRLGIYYTEITSAGPAPFVIKPGEIQIFDLSEDMSILRQNLSNLPPNAWTDFGLTTRVVMPDGSISIKSSPVGKVRNGPEQADSSPYVEVQLSEWGSRFPLILTRGMPLFF